MGEEKGGKYVEPGGEFTRDQRYIATRITEDGRDGYPVEPGRTGWRSAAPARGPTD